MISERIYRALLALYPREHRLEYGELMVQLFRDRMRHEGGGFRWLVVWTQMISDLAGSAFEEHKRGGDTKKRMWIAVGSVAALLVIAVGIGIALSQSEGEEEIVSLGSSVLSAYGEGDDSIPDAVQQAVKDGALFWENAHQIEFLCEGETFTAFVLTVVIANQDVELDSLDKLAVDDEITFLSVKPAAEDSPDEKWSYFFNSSASQSDTRAETVIQAVEHDVIPQDVGDQLLQSFRRDTVN